MCGIIGYTSKEEVVTGKIIKGLKRLEPRGYDSRGIAILGRGVYKDAIKGDISEFIKRLPQEYSGYTGIGHTRWATHGKIADKNAHPHSDSKNEIFIAHNGVIENFKNLIIKYSLEKILQSETDSEIIAHIIRHHIDQGSNFFEAFKKTVDELHGAYGITAIYEKEPHMLLGAKNGSPLYIGKGTQGYFLSSAQTAFHGFVEDSVALDDGEICKITPHGYEIEDMQGALIPRKLTHLDVDFTSVDKEGYKHFMIKEIEETPAVIQNTLRGRIHKNDSGILEAKLGGMENSIPEIKKAKRVFFVGCGTAYHAGLFGSYLFETFVRIPSQTLIATDFVDNDYIIPKDSILIAISQSGTTKDTIDAVQKAKKQGIPTFGIVNVVGSDIARITDAGVYNHAGPEIGVASTKALTSQILVLGLMAAFFGEYHNMKGSDKQKILTELSELEDVTKKLFQEDKSIKKVAKFASKYSHGCFLGSNKESWVPLEASLKLREISYLDFMGFPASELKHGSLALVDDSYLTIAVCQDDVSIAKMRTNLSTIHSRGGPIIEILPEDSSESEYSYSINYPKGFSIFEGLLASIQLQRFSYYFADFLGREIDRPRNLAKTVTVD
jgi:glucosamine--fructose-6-phosphate aminotransferase (isomerizing)